MPFLLCRRTKKATEKPTTCRASYLIWNLEPPHSEEATPILNHTVFKLYNDCMSAFFYTALDGTACHCTATQHPVLLYIDMNKVSLYDTSKKLGEKTVQCALACLVRPFHRGQNPFKWISLLSEGSVRWFPLSWQRTSLCPLHYAGAIGPCCCQSVSVSSGRA